MPLSGNTNSGIRFSYLAKSNTTKINIAFLQAVHLPANKRLLQIYNLLQLIQSSCLTESDPDTELYLYHSLHHSIVVILHEKKKLMINYRISGLFPGQGLFSLLPIFVAKVRMDSTYNENLGLCLCLFSWPALSNGI